MSAKECIGVAEFGTVDDNFDNVDWIASIDVSYNLLTNQTTYEARDKRRAKHNILQSSQV